MKKLGISTLISIGGILLFTLLLTIFSYLDWMGPKTIAVMKLIIPILSLFIGGFWTGKQSQQKGWLEGMKMGLLFLVVLTFFNLLGVQMNWEWKQLIYDGILLISASFGSMIGINFKGTQN